jgi:cell wall-associated NlpC family hydrolase
MPKSPARNLAPWRLHARRLALAGCVSIVSMSASAAPDAAADPITRFLAERGLGDGHELIGQVRDRASELVLTAMNFLGVPYRRGGQSEAEGFDCSGFTRAIFERSLGLVLPRRVDEQASAPGLRNVRRDDLQPGDLVFFNTLRRSFSHVGIYVGEGKFIHAPRSGAAVRVEDMTLAYWARRFTGARRAGDAPAATPPASGAALPADALTAAPGITSASYLP